MTETQLNEIHEWDRDCIRTRVEGDDVAEDILHAILKSLHRIEHQLNEARSHEA